MRALFKRRIASVGDVLVNVGRINIPGVAQGDALLQGHHRVVLEVGDACGRLRWIPEVTDGVLRQRIAARCMLINDTLGKLGRHLSIEYAGAAGHLNVKQRFGKTQTEGPDLRHVCRDLLLRLFQGGFDRGNDFEPSGGLPG